MCPAHLQLPQGKKLPISITGMLPYVIRNEQKEIVGGAELKIIDIYAKKFDFKPKLIPATQFDGGMIDTVIIVVLIKNKSCTGWGIRMLHRKSNNGPNGPYWPVMPIIPFNVRHTASPPVQNRMFNFPTGS